MNPLFRYLKSSPPEFMKINRFINVLQTILLLKSVCGEKITTILVMLSIVPYSASGTASALHPAPSPSSTVLLRSEHQGGGSINKENSP
jgi:hypothetical protein